MYYIRELIKKLRTLGFTHNNSSKVFLIILKTVKS
jgi:hypothetical protein